MNKKVWYGITALLLCFQAGFAQTSLTVAQAVELALKNNVTVEQSYTDLQGLKRKKSRSANGFSPSLSVGTGISRPNNNLSNTYNVVGTASVSFTLTSQAITSIQQAKLNYEAGIIDYDSTLRSVELAVRKAFYGLLYEKVYVDLQQRNLETSRSRYEQTLEKYRRGVLPELDAISAQVNFENLKTPLATAEISYQNNFSSFKQLIGLSLEEDVTLIGSLQEALELKEIILPEHIVSLTVRSLEKQLESAKLGVGSAQARAYSPTLSFGYTHNPTMNSSHTANWPDNGSLSASISLPIDSWLPWSPAKETIDTAKDSVTTVELALKDAKVTAQVNIASCQRSIGQSMLSVQNGLGSVELARKSYEMMLDAYNRGTKDLLSLENAATALFESEVLLMSQAYNLLTAIMDLENEVNVPFGTLGK